MTKKFCPHCFETTTPILRKKFGARENANHVGIYCRACGRWIKWANKKEVTIWDLINENTLF